MIMAKEDFNDYYRDTDSNMNHKYISKIEFSHNRVRIHFETERKLQNILRRGNALRQYSRFLAKDGFDPFVHEHQLMRAV